jgi:predicted nucleic acid-binding protein
LNKRDPAHGNAVAFTQSYRRQLHITTTAAVLLEVGDGLAKTRHARLSFMSLQEQLRSDPDVAIVPLSDQLWRQAVDLFGNRIDKDWSLTDCVSFAVMQGGNITEALTGDHHFEQAGFVALLI